MLSDRYECCECELFYTLQENDTSEIQCEHPNGEGMIVTLSACPYCGAMSIPEGVNKTSRIVAGMRSTYPSGSDMLEDY